MVALKTYEQSSTSRRRCLSTDETGRQREKEERATAALTGRLLDWLGISPCPP